MMLYAKFGWNWPSGSGEEDEIKKSLQTDKRTTGDQKSSLSSGELKKTKIDSYIFPWTLFAGV